MLDTSKYQLESWQNILDPIFRSKHFKALANAIQAEKENGKEIFPAEENIFRAFELCSLKNCKVVILGQDPYHDDGQAHGLSFSVPQNVKIPPSLKNIYKEIYRDLNINNFEHGNLSSWAKQGVLLLNSILTVNAHEPASHRKFGWEAFTDQVIMELSKEKEHVVFLLWGSFAQKKATLIDQNKHLILSSVHPSPLSAYRGFFGCQHFSKCNTYLEEHGQQAIDWRI